MKKSSKNENLEYCSFKLANLTFEAKSEVSEAIIREAIDKLDYHKCSVSQFSQQLLPNKTNWV